MTSEKSETQSEPATFTEAVLGKGIAEERWTRRFMQWSADRRIAVVVALLGAVLFLPYLGAVGLWDPWETHYGEVARSMIQRNDYVFPYWENAWFFSKTPMTMWLQALGMQVVGAMSEPGAMGRLTEWGMRVPFALLSIGALMLLAIALGRVINRRVGLAAAFALATMPTWFLLTRQTVTDTPFVTTLVAAMACAIIGQFDGQTKHRAAWWYAFWVLCGVSALSKGIMGIGLPAVFLGLWFLLVEMPWDGRSLAAHGRWLVKASFRRRVAEGLEPMPALWAQFSRMRLLTGLGVFLAVVGPWFLVMHLFEGVDDESKRFWYRFWIHDHFNRLAAGVHTTTPGGEFTYFIEQGAYGIFPWVAAVPGALAVASKLKLRGGDTRDKVGILALIWSAGFFLLITLSATKFHHYIFPALPGLAILVALFVDRLWEDGLVRHTVSLVLGMVLFLLVGKDLAANPKHFPDLFVYNYTRPYPTELLTRPVGFLGDAPLTVGLVLGIAFLLVGLYFLADGLSKEGRRESKVWGGVTIALGLLLVFLMLGKSGAPRGLREVLTVKSGLGVFFGVAGGLMVLGALSRSKTAVFATFWALSASFALWLGWSHWVDLSHHWTQRDLFWRYYDQRQESEPIAAFLMNWRGETFYSRNTVQQIPSERSSERMRQYAAQPGREWALVEHNRLGILRNAVGTDKNVTVIDRDLNNKFVLVTID